ncbi:MAG: hypothetical protein IK045_07270 [Bacteroidales bacterium]|nr:hypothetical protein [Bacteroidales bacterium]
MKHLTVTLLALSALMFCFCAKTPPAGGDEGPRTASSTVTPEGGTVNLGAVTLQVPAGAVEEDVKVGSTYYPADLKMEQFVSEAGGVIAPPGEPLARIDFSPEGLEFNEPVTVEFPAPAIPADQLAVFYYDDSQGSWQIQDGVSVSGSKASFKISHFSSYVAAGIGFAQMDRFPGRVDSGIRSGKSPQEIVDEFHNWLMTGEGRQMMQTPHQWRGIWFTPFLSITCGRWAIHTPDLESEPEGDIVAYTGTLPAEDASFRGFSVSASYNSSYMKHDEFIKKINGETIEQKRQEQMRLYDVLNSIDYRLAEPRMDLSVSGKLEAKGDEATVTVTLDLPDPSQGRFIPVEYTELTVTSSDPSAVSVSESKVTTDGDGKATFKVKVLSDEADATVTVNYHMENPLWKFDDGTTQDDVVDVNKSIHVSVAGEQWEATFSIEIKHTMSVTVENYLGSLDNQYNFPDITFTYWFGGSIRMTVVKETSTAAQSYFESTGEYLSADEWADLGVDPDSEVTYDRIRGTYSVSIDPSKDVDYDYADRTCSWRSHQELHDDLFSWDRDEYYNSTLSFSMSFPTNNSKSDVAFESTANDSRKMTPVPLVPYSSAVSMSDLNWLYDNALLVARLNSTHTLSVRVEDTLEGPSSNTETKNSEVDGFLLPSSLHFSLQEGTHTLSFEGSAAAFSGALPEVYIALVESEPPYPGDGAEAWITNHNNTKTISGTITIHKVTPEE